MRRQSAGGPVARSRYVDGARRGPADDGAHSPGARGVGVLGTIAAVVLAALVLGALAPSAWASDQGNRSIARYDVDVQLGVDGTARVTVDFDFDFADTPGHGPYLTLPLVQEIQGEEDLVRSYPVSDVSASSPSGAPANVYLTDTGTWLEIRIGDEDIGDVSGIQRYVVQYTIRGLVNPGAGAAGEDELYWNVVGADWTIPLNDISVSVSGPALVADTTCFAGPTGTTDPCTSDAFDGVVAAFTQDSLGRYEPLTIAVAYPAGTFVGAEPIIIDRPRPLNPIALTPWTGGLAALVLAGGGAYVVRRSGQRGRDQQYLGLTPGLLPVPGQDVPVGPASRSTPVAVQFHPPKGVRPGELGTLADERADPRDVTATIVDLAVRGYITIEETEPPGRFGRGGDWVLRFRGGPGDGLATYERELMDSIFATSMAPSLSGMKTTFASAMARVQQKLYDEVTLQGWFRSNPQSARMRWLFGGIGILALGVVMLVVLGSFGWGLVGAAIVGLGLLTMALMGRAPARTATGTAILAQTLGFKRYLETAEAHQLRFEEGEDLFSRYLPYAIVFGVAERWAGIFEQLAREGRAIAEPSWYVGRSYAPGYFWLGASHFGSTMESFSAVATTAISAPTPGSSGGSGFGGGGFSGGGGGGGGGGGW